MILQILNGSIEASWVLAVCGVTIAFFLVRTISKIDKNLDKHEKQINNIILVQLKMLAKLGISDEYFQELSKEVEK